MVALVVAVAACASEQPAGLAADADGGARALAAWDAGSARQGGAEAAGQTVSGFESRGVEAGVPALVADAGAIVCGDGRCQAAENCATCESDCGGCPAPSPDASVACAHTECQAGSPLSPGCGACAAAICAADPFCCDTAWDNLCVGALGAVCGKACP